MSSVSPEPAPPPSYAALMAKEKPSVDRAIASYAAPQAYSQEETELLAKGQTAYKLFDDKIKASNPSLSSLSTIGSKKDNAASYKTRTKLTSAKILNHGHTIYT